MPSFERKGKAYAPLTKLLLYLYVTILSLLVQLPPGGLLRLQVYIIGMYVCGEECMDRLQNSLLGRTFAQLYEVTHATSRGTQIVLFRNRIKSLDFVEGLRYGVALSPIKTKEQC